MKLPTIDQADVAGKKVFVRGDIDVPLEQIAVDGGDPSTSLRMKVADDSRLLFIWPTIEYLLKQDCTVLLAGHLGRPGGKVVPELSSKAVAEWIRRKAGEQESRITVMENLRFDPREEANPSAGSGQADEYAKELASLADVYVNEAFGASYDDHASIAGVPKFLPHFAGLRLAKEVEVLSKVLENPQRPLLVIIGGAKAETKVPVIAKMQEFADRVLVGGKIVTEVFPFAREHGLDLNRDKVITFPLTANFCDIFPQAIYAAADDFLLAQTIVWNGPFGAIEEEDCREGTEKLIDLILQNKRALKIVGGGDTVGFLNKLGLSGKFDWVSSGGGSMLKFLSGEKLPGLEALLE